MLVFLRFVGQAVAARGLKALLGLVPLGEQIFEIAEDALERYRAEQRLNALRVDIEQVAQASAEEIRTQARQIAKEVLAGQPIEQVHRLEQYLTQVPAITRQTLKRPDDLAGATVPPYVHLQEPLQLSLFLPRRLARFQAGEPVPHAPQWQLVQLLGAGGFGEVWLAQHSFLTHQQRAYKFCLDAEARERLLRHEGEVVKQVMQASQNMRDDQNGIVPLLDAYLGGETTWLAYEYVEGGDLSTIVRQHAELEPEKRGERSLHYLIALAEVIGQFHTLPRPIVHRDLKPTNILVKQRGDDLFLRVTDFGISHVEADRGIYQATIPRPQASLGPTYRGAYTPIYASPQQKRSMKPDVRDDVHALGIIGWQLLLGDLAAERPAGKWRKRLAATGLSDAVLDVLESCWDDDPDERPANAALLAERLREVNKVPVSASRTMPSPEAVFQVLRQKIQEDYRSYEQFARCGNGTTAWLKQHEANTLIWQEAAAKNLPKAMVLLGDCHEDGVGVTQDYAEAMKWYRKAADLGDADAMINIGMLYSKGHGVTRDLEETIRWYRKAAELGNADGMSNIGWFYECGYGVTQDFEEAMKWYRKAAEAGQADAMRNIGLMYSYGKGVAMDHAEAIRWFHRAAAEGDGNAMACIGWSHEDGRGVPQDNAEAMKWFQKAADAGDVFAMNHLGCLYANGESVDQDYAEAMRWFRKAVEAGDEGAKARIAMLEKKMKR